MSRVMIIAEAGVNHNGELEKALSLIDAAAEAGADFVKFQTFKTENLVQRNAQKANYQIDNTGDSGSQFEMLKKLEIPADWYPLLVERCRERNIGFLSTGFDEESIDFLDKQGCLFYKIPSGEITNKPYLRHIASKKKPIILSTGMSDLEDIRAALVVLKLYGARHNEITVLHCNTEYPTPMTDVNLKAMLTIEEEFDIKVGYSDHTQGTEVAIAAVTLGARVIEKHFTLDRYLPGPDHLASLEPDELTAMVKAIRNVETAISGSGMKLPSPSELKNRIPARKSIHLNKDLSEGQMLTEADLVMLRPGDGISPMLMDDVIGKKLSRDVVAFAKIEWEDLQ